MAIVDIANRPWVVEIVPENIVAEIADESVTVEVPNGTPLVEFRCCEDLVPPDPTGYVYEGVNLGAGEGIYTSVDQTVDPRLLKFKSLTSADGTVDITSNDTEVDLSVTCCGNGAGAGYQDTTLVGSAAPACGPAYSAGPPETVAYATFTPATDIPAAQVGDFCVLVFYYTWSILAGVDVSFDGVGWTKLAGPGYHGFSVYTKFLEVADLNDTVTMSGVGVKATQICRAAFAYRGVNTEAPIYSFTSDYRIHPETPYWRDRTGWASPAAAFADGQHILTITNAGAYNVPYGWSDWNFRELGEIPYEVEHDAVLLGSTDTRSNSIHFGSWKANINAEENLIPGETLTASFQDPSWTFNACSVSRVSTEFSQLANSATTDQHYAERTLDLQIGDKVTFYVAYRGNTGNFTMPCHMYTVAPSGDERGKFFYFVDREIFAYSTIDDGGDENTSWWLHGWRYVNDGIPSTDGSWLVYHLTATEAGTYRFRFGPAVGADGSSTTFTASGLSTVLVRHAGLRMGHHNPRFIPTASGAVSGQAVTGLADLPGWLVSSSTPVQPHGGTQFSLVINPDWIKYPQARISPINGADGSGVFVTGSDGEYDIWSTGWLQDDFAGQAVCEKFLSPTLQGSPGKYYWEAECLGVIGRNNSGQAVGMSVPMMHWADGSNQGSSPTYAYDKWTETGGTHWAVNDVVGIAVDYENEEIKWYLNNVLVRIDSMGQGDLPLCAVTQGPLAFWPYGTAGWRVRFREPFTYAPPTGFVPYDVTGDPSFTFGTVSLNVGGGAEVVNEDTTPTTYRTILSGDGISVTQETNVIRIAQNISDLALIGDGNADADQDTIPIYDTDTATHKRITLEQVVAAALNNDVPANASATGTVGAVACDENYLYICTAANTWKRVAIATW